MPVKNVLVVISLLLLTSFNCKNDAVLVFTKTEGFRHESIEIGVDNIKALGLEKGFNVSHTEDANMFNSEKLKQFDLVIFLSTTGDVLNENQQEAFEQFIKKGGSFMGIHAAADTEYNWPWYGKLVGAYFMSHPKISEASVVKTSNTHKSCEHLPERSTRKDEWYNYKNINPNINVLLKLDESSYKGGENGENHPIAWYHEFDGGKSFYTGGGHTKSSYSEPEFRQHLLGGILYCLGN